MKVAPAARVAAKILADEVAAGERDERSWTRKRWPPDQAATRLFATRRNRRYCGARQSRRALLVIPGRAVARTRNPNGLHPKGLVAASSRVPVRAMKARTGMTVGRAGLPDGTVARKRFWRGNFLFAQDPALGSPGFKRFRPIVRDKNGTLRRLTNEDIGKDPQLPHRCHCPA
jgi:hypothetical protein